MRPTTMAGASAAEDGGTITTAARNKHTANPIHFIPFICNSSLSTMFLVLVVATVISIMVFVITITVAIAVFTVTVGIVTTVMRTSN